MKGKGLRKRLLSLLLALTMVLSLMPLSAAAEENSDTTAVSESVSLDYRIVHLDCGRKYFSVDNIKSIIDIASAAGFNNIELAVGNDGLRFLLDDMSVSFEVETTTYVETGAEEEAQADTETESEESIIEEVASDETEEAISSEAEESITEEVVSDETEEATSDEAEESIAEDAVSDEATDEETANEESVETQSDVTEPADTSVETPLKEVVNYNNYSYSSDAVRTAVQTANKAYYDAGEQNELTQAEMDEIIAYANEKGMGVIPLLNTPGHMNAIVSAMKTLGINGSYDGSANTIDVTNTDAVAFTKALLQKYVTYFAEKGCTLFNFGADEYANDIYSTGGMGFAQLVNAGQYDEFVAYINDLAAMIKDAGMIPMAFNDGIYYNRDTSNAIDTDIMVTYWSSGWSGYNVASASFLADQGFKMINTHGDYYWVLGKTDAQCSAEKAAGFDATAFMGNSTISDPAGAMFCIWCDVPGADTADSVVANTKETIIAFGGALTGTGSGGDEDNTDTSATVTDNTTGISITANGLTGVTASKTETDVTVEDAKELIAYEIVPTTDDGNYIGSATVSIPVSDTWTNVRGGVLASANGEEVTGIEGTLADGKFTFEVPHFSTVVVYELGENNLEQRTITVTAGSTATDTISGVNYADGTEYTTEDSAIATVTVNGTDEVPEGTTYTRADVTYNALINSNSSSWKETGYYYQVGENYYPLYAQRSSDRVMFWTEYTYRWGYSTSSSVNDVTPIGSSETTYDYNNSPDIIVYTQSRTDAVPASTTVTFRAAADAAGKTTYATIGNIRYTINVADSDLDNADPLTVEFWITNSTVTTNGTTEMEISASQAYGENGVLISTLVPATGVRTGADNEVAYWKTTRLDYKHQQVVDGEDRTLQGDDFTLIRYWGDEWQYSADGDQWTSVVSGDQIVAYYLQVTDVTTEITTNVVDWGQTYYEWRYTEDNRWFWDGYVENGSKYVFLDFAVVYEDGTQNPNSFPVNNTMFYHFDGNSASNPRVLGAVSFTENEDFEIWKVTVQDGTSSGYQSPSKFTSTYEGEEVTVWDESMGGTPHIDSLSYYANRSGKLVRIYVRAKVTEDALTVHYVDRTANDEFYNYNISVISGTIFDPSFALDADYTDIANALTGNTVENSRGVIQTVTADLTQMTEIGAQYRGREFRCVEVRRSEDGKDVYLYYTFNDSQPVVYDYGLPITVTTENMGLSNVADIEITNSSSLAYGDATSTNGGVTYTPNTMSPRSEDVVLTITYTDGETTTYRLTMIPATSVYYEDDCGLIAFSSGWGTTGNSVNASQAYNTTPYGNDAAYGNYTAYSNGSTHETTINKGEATQTATFTFTGTGFDIYSQTGKDNGLMSIRVVNDEGTTVKNISVQNTGNDTLYQIPVYTVKDLAHDTYTVTVTAFAANTNTAYPSLNRGGYHVIDAVQIYNPLTAEGTQYQTDKEANAVRLNIRDAIVGAQDYGDNGQGNGVLYMNANIDGGSVIDYTLVGPNNEAYFKSTDSMIGFILETSEQVETLQIGAKSADGNPVTLKATVNGTETTTAISTNTAMNYVLNGGTPTQVDGKYQYNVYISKSAGTGILSITDVKATFAAAATAEFKYNEELVNALSASVDEPAETEAAIVENGVSIATSRVRYGRDMTMKVVTTGVLQEGQIFTVKAGNRTYTIDAKSSLYRLNVGDPVDNGDGTYTYTINLKPYAYSLRLKSTTFTVTLSGSEGTSTSGSASAVVRLL